MASANEGVGVVAAAIDTVEETYEFMLAYAAQGRRVEEDGGPARELLKRSVAAMDVLRALTPELVGLKGGQATADVQSFLDVVNDDARKAQAAFRFVLSQHNIGSQIIDNLNASIHVRALLTDLFLLDESLKISGL